VNALKPLHYSLLLVVLYHMTYSGTRLLVALYAIHLKASPAVIGMLVAIFSIVPMLGGVAIGRLIDRRGSKALMLLCGTLMFAGTLLAFAWRDITALIVVNVLVGAGYYGLYIAAQQLFGRLGKPEDRMSNFAWLSSAYAVSAILAPVLTGFGIDHIGHNQTFLMLSALPVLVLAILLSGKLTNLGPSADSHKAEAARGNVLELIGKGELRRVYAMSVLIATSWDTFLFMTPIYCSQLGISASRIGIIIASFSVATLTIRLFTQALTKRFSAWQLMIISIAAAGASNFAFGFAASVPFLILFAFLLGLGQGIAGPMMNTLLYEESPPGRVTEVIGLRLLISKGYQAGLPLLTGTLGTVLGVAPVFWLVSTVMLGGAYAVRAQWHRTEKR